MTLNFTLEGTTYHCTSETGTEYQLVPVGNPIGYFKLMARVPKMLATWSSRWGNFTLEDAIDKANRIEAERVKSIERKKALMGEAG